MLSQYHIFLERESCFKPKQLKFLPKILGEVNAFWAKSHYFGFYLSNGYSLANLANSSTRAKLAKTAVF
jgi:hypothetical protein